MLAEAVELLQSCVPVSTENSAGRLTPQSTDHIPVVTGSLGRKRGRERGRDKKEEETDRGSWGGKR